MNEHEEKMFLDILNERNGCGRTLLYGCILALVVLCLCACKTVKYVPVETVRTDTVYQSKIEKDSIHVRDSVYLHEWIKGDTVYIEKTKWHTAIQERLRTDTIYRSRVDSLRIPYLVEREISRWEQVKMDYGAVAIGVSIAAVIGLIIAIILWLRRKGIL